VLVSLLSEETTDSDGNYYQLKGARNEPKGVQRPHPPICIGGSGEKCTLPLTALRPALELRRRPEEITKSAHLRLEADRNYEQVLDDAAALAAEGLDLGIVYISPPHDPSVLEALAEAIRDSGLWNG
jgi:hypothetical protein